MSEVKPLRGWRCGWLLLVLFHLVSCSRTHREHKVHNIVLYPGKHSWCKTTPIKQVVAWPGCVAKEIDNNVCVGACFSYTIPQTQPSAPGDVISPYCDSCQASEVTWKEVTLECTATEDMDSKLLEVATESPLEPPQNASRPMVLMKKKVQMIANCSCSSCHGHHGGGHGGGGGGGGGGHHPFAGLHHEPDSPELLHQQQDVPELMGLVQEIQNRKVNGNGHPHLRASNRTLHELLVNTTFSEGDIVHQLSASDDSEEEESEHSEHPGHVFEHPEHHEHPERPEEASPAVSEATLPLNVAGAESLSLPISAFEHPRSTEASTSSHPSHPHHNHHHHGFHHATHLEVAHEKLHPAHEGAEVSYHENLVNPEQSQETSHPDTP